jgi:hypothetical protein
MMGGDLQMDDTTNQNPNPGMQTPPTDQSGTGMPTPPSTPPAMPGEEHGTDEPAAPEEPATGMEHPVETPTEEHDGGETPPAAPTGGMPGGTM